VKIDGTPVEVNSAAYINLIKQWEREDDIASVDATSAHEAVQEITAVAREQVAQVRDALAPLDSYPLSAQGHFQDRYYQAPRLMFRHDFTD
jgi:hypothetical protein